MILLTGATGYIGQNLMKRRKDRHHIVAISRRIFSCSCGSARCAEIVRTGVLSGGGIYGQMALAPKLTATLAASCALRCNSGSKSSMLCPENADTWSSTSAMASDSQPCSAARVMASPSCTARAAAVRAAPSSRTADR